MITRPQMIDATQAELSAGLALKASSITKTYPGVIALQDVELEAYAGEVLGVVGENGAGKSTLMGVVSGAVQPDSGRVEIAGEELAPFQPDTARGFGLAMVRQEPALLPDLTVAENLHLGMPQKLQPALNKLGTWAEEILSMWDPKFKLDSSLRVEQLLPEQRFIVEICRAIASKPKVLVLDEPTEHLAATDVQILFAHIRRLVEHGSAVIYISHRISEVKEISHRISVLRNGQSKGTHMASELSASDIVDLIVGRVLEATFPPKPGRVESEAVKFSASGFRGPQFEGIQLHAAPGEIIGLAGIDGNGQREFLRALAGIGKSSGEVHVDGRAVTLRSSASAAASGIAYVAQDRHREGVFAGLGIRENVAARILPHFAVGGFMSARSENGVIRQVAEKFSVKAPHLEADIASLSGGNQQKAVLAGAFAANPEVLLLDEPTQGVDVGARSEIYALIRARAAETGMAVIVLSADAKELEGLCDRVLVFSRGHVVNELVGSDVREQAITDTALKATSVREKINRDEHRVGAWLAGDTAPVLLVGAALIALGIFAQILNPLFLSERSIFTLLMMSTTLIFAALAQNLVLLVGGIDLSVGPYMGLAVVVLSFFLVDGTSGGLQLVGWVLLLAMPVALGLANWMLSDIGGIHPMIATLVTYMAL
ncbi:ATP-binding cassette domain-containing protein, partial [Glutamicibacter halophytocola]|uniref:ATP-binding cassette domain-containing protein n=1 Tax=Glutamicibacter halophytocola TaxID=1933880 RepID=UPI0015C53025